MYCTISIFYFSLETDFQEGDIISNTETDALSNDMENQSFRLNMMSQVEIGKNKRGNVVACWLTDNNECIKSVHLTKTVAREVSLILENVAKKAIHRNYLKSISKKKMIKKNN